MLVGVPSSAVINSNVSAHVLVPCIVSPFIHKVVHPS